MAIPFSTFVQHVRESSRDAFLAGSPAFYLVQLEATELEGQIQALTLLPDAELEREGDPALIHALAKPSGSQNPFAFMITVGRAGNNDVVIRDQAVSGFHAYFRQLGATWTIADANSTYGTTVDGSPLPAERGRSISSGALIRLADRVSIEFIAADELYDRLSA